MTGLKRWARQVDAKLAGIKESADALNEMIGLKSPGEKKPKSPLEGDMLTAAAKAADERKKAEEAERERARIREEGAKAEEAVVKQIEQRYRAIFDEIKGKYDAMVGKLRGPESKAGQRYRERNEQDAARYEEKQTEYQMKAMRSRDAGDEEKAAEYEREAERYGGYAAGAKRRADPRAIELRERQAREMAQAQAAMAAETKAAGGTQDRAAGGDGKGVAKDAEKATKAVERMAIRRRAAWRVWAPQWWMG
jgi:hypothetical protein